MDTDRDVCDAGRMSAVDDRRAELGDVEAPAPPEALTVLEVFNLQKLVREQLRRAQKRAQRNVESGRVNELSGEDANVGRIHAFTELDTKLQAWLDGSWPAVDAAQAAMVGEGEGDTVGEARWRALRDLEVKIGREVVAGQAEVVVVSEGVRGMLGVGYEPAIVLARLSEADS